MGEFKKLFERTKIGNMELKNRIVMGELIQVGTPDGAVTDDIINKLDHNDLNNIEYFKEGNPTSENIAKYIFEKIKTKSIPVKNVIVSETDDYSAEYSEEE